MEQVLVAYDPEPRCRVCALGAGEFGRAARKRIDWLLGRGYGYQEILEDVQGLLALVPVDQHPGYDSIRRHFERHLDPDSKLIRSMLERHAAQQGINIPEGQERVVTSAGVFDLVRQKGLEALVAGELKPSLRETLQASHLLQTLEDKSLRQQLNEMAMLARTMLGLVRDRLSPDDAEALGLMIQRPLQGATRVALASPDPRNETMLTTRDQMPVATRDHQEGRGITGRRGCELVCMRSMREDDTDDVRTREAHQCEASAEN